MSRFEEGGLLSIHDVAACMLDDAAEHRDAWRSMRLADPLNITDRERIRIYVADDGSI